MRPNCDVAVLRICLFELIKRPFLPRPMVGYVRGLLFVQLAVWDSIGSV